jgi:glutathione S-transferase
MAFPSAAASALSRRFHLLGPAWTRVSRCVWMMEELGVPFELHEEYYPGSRRAHSFHPSGKVPVLLEYIETNNETKSEPSTLASPDFVLYESVAINTYLGDLHPEQGLVPPVGTHDRARYDQACCYILSELDAQGLWVRAKYERMGDIYGYLPDAVEKAQKHFDKHYKIVLDKYCSSPGPYILGSQFSAADILYSQCLDWALATGWDVSAADSYRKLYRERPGYQRMNQRRRESQKNMLEQRQAFRDELRERGALPKPAVDDTMESSSQSKL